MKLITSEYTECTDQNMINEYNELTYELKRELAKFSDDEVLTKHRRIIFLFSIIVEYPKNEQQTLF